MFSPGGILYKYMYWAQIKLLRELQWFPYKISDAFAKTQIKNSHRVLRIEIQTDSTSEHTCLTWRCPSWVTPCWNQALPACFPPYLIFKGFDGGVFVSMTSLLQPPNSTSQPSSMSRVIQHMSNFPCKLSQQTHTHTHTAPLLPTSHGWSICCGQNASWCTHTHTLGSGMLITLLHTHNSQICSHGRPSLKTQTLQTHLVSDAGLCIFRDLTEDSHQLCSSVGLISLF